VYEYEIDFIQKGEPRKALESLLSQVPMRSQDPALYVNMAIAFEDLGEFSRAERGYRFVLDRWPNSVEAMNNLANFLVRTGRVDEAATWAEKAVELTPDGYCLHALGMVRIEQLRIDDALIYFKAAAELAGTAHNPAAARAWSDFISYALHTGFDEAAHRDWVKRFGETPIEPTINWDGKRPLRVGFVGDCFRKCAVASMLYQVMEALDPEKITPCIYSDVPVRLDGQDAVKWGFKCNVLNRGGVWWDIATNSDDAVAAQIRRDKIDVIVDLQGHKQRSRLGALCQNPRPAPIMLGYIGYAGDTFITENIDQAVGWAYRPADDAPPVTPLPMLKNGHVTFGSVHRPAKINAQSAQCWGRILSATPNARLRVTVNGGEQNKSARGTLVGHGIPGDRLELIPRPPTHAGYLALADSIDIHLDTFPYGGGATTCDMLWQGVPTLVMVGGKYSMGESIMRSVGLRLFVATSEDDFVNAAQRRIDAAELFAIRSGLRDAMKPLLDGAMVARRMEELCRSRAESVRASTQKVVAECCG